MMRDKINELNNIAHAYRHDGQIDSIRHISANILTQYDDMFNGFYLYVSDRVQLRILYSLFAIHVCVSVGFLS